MADRPMNMGQNMAVSSASVSSQHNHRDVGREENDVRIVQGNSKSEQPKKKTTFKITNVTKSSAQRGGSGDLTGDNDHDIDSTDDLDETVDPDSHTEELNSEILDMSRGTDIDNQEILTPDEMVKEKGITSPEETAVGTGKSARFKVVKIETREPFRRGRWECLDFLDEKTDTKQEEIHINSGNSSGANSAHESAVDDHLKNPSFAGASGTMPVLYQQSSAADGMAAIKGEIFQPIHPAPVSLSQPGLTLVNHMNSDHIAQSSITHPYIAPAQTIGPSSMAIVPNPLLQGPVPAMPGTVPTLPPLPTGQTYTSQSLAGNIPYPSSQPQQLPQSTSVPPSIISHVPHIMPQPIYDLGGQQPAMYDISGQQPSYVMNAVPMSMAGAMVTNTTAVLGGTIPSMMPQPNHLSTGVPSQPQIMDSYVNDHEIQSSRSATLIVGQPSTAVDNPAPMTASLTTGAGLQPLDLAVGEITNSQVDEEINEDP